MAQPSAHTVAHPADMARLADHRRSRQCRPGQTHHRPRRNFPAPAPPSALTAQAGTKSPGGCRSAGQRTPLALVSPVAVPGRNADGLVPGRPENRGTRVAAAVLARARSNRALRPGLIRPDRSQRGSTRNPKDAIRNGAAGRAKSGPSMRIALKHTLSPRPHWTGGYSPVQCGRWNIRPSCSCSESPISSSTFTRYTGDPSGGGSLAASASSIRHRMCRMVITSI